MDDQTDFDATHNNATPPSFDPEHPWAEASLHADPMPVPTNVKVEGVELTSPDGSTNSAALMTYVTPVGVFSFFLPPAGLHAVLLQGTAIMRDWAESENQGLQVAGKHDMENAIAQQRAAEGFRR